MRRIDPETGKLSTQDRTMYSLSSQPRTPPIGGSVEAPFLIRHGGCFYLFVSFDRCCRGADSTYNVVVGRARKVTGLARTRPRSGASGTGWRLSGFSRI